MSHSFSLKGCLGLAEEKRYPKITTPLFRLVLQNFALPGCILFYRYFYRYFHTETMRYCYRPTDTPRLLLHTEPPKPLPAHWDPVLLLSVHHMILLPAQEDPVTPTCTPTPRDTHTCTLGLCNTPIFTLGGTLWYSYLHKKTLWLLPAHRHPVILIPAHWDSVILLSSHWDPVILIPAHGDPCDS